MSSINYNSTYKCFSHDHKKFVIPYGKSLESTKFLPLQPLNANFTDADTIFVNHTIGCMFSQQTIYKQLHTSPLNVYIFDEEKRKESDFGYYAYISIKKPKTFKEATLNNTIQTVYMECELDTLKEYISSNKTHKSVENKVTKDNLRNIARKPYYELSEKINSVYLYDDSYYKRSKPKQRKTLYFKKKSQTGNKKSNYMKSKTRRIIEQKKISILNAKKKYHSIKHKRTDPRKLDCSSQNTLCDDCNSQLSQNNACKYYNYKLCIDCYNHALLYDEYENHYEQEYNSHGDFMREYYYR
jgi:hypothetical protein